ncbi:hypothetical protein FCI23_46915 [Actinacidiphila oryziradicis]|uniref:Uncharacterized protein n=1 Tax=Actinacidiphila oryziradicis TaxID=2571141 RepID=A0A4U0RSP0_9ACTN|nr:hypothetical protein FCI23_46915 [Actinacidiphila oryziradicis]
MRFGGQLISHDSTEDPVPAKTGHEPSSHVTPLADPNADGSRATLRPVVYISALATGLALVIWGHATPVEASGYVTPFLVIFERRG